MKWTNAMKNPKLKNRNVKLLNWSNVTSAIQDDGTTKMVIVNPPSGNRFYRLHKP
jgi:hypothetical protein